MKDKNKVIIISLMIISVLTLILKINNIEIVKADSGFDSSYDSGSSSSSWGSSSSWSSSSSSDWRSSSSGSSSGFSELTPAEAIPLLIFVVILVITIIYNYILIYKEDKNGLVEEFQKRKEEKETEINEVCPEGEQQFLENRYNDFIEIQKAWMNFDYKKLRELLTDELYNQYEMQLETLKSKNQQNIMTDFSFKESRIKRINKSNDEVSVEIYLYVCFHDYIEEDGKVVRGNKRKKIGAHYNIVFTSKLSPQKISKCPKCGAKIEKNQTNKCPYCRTIISKENKKWVMSKKELPWQD